MYKRQVADKEELSEAVNDIMKEYDERHEDESNEDKSTVNIKFLRGGEKMSADITPVRMDDGRYYMGIWVKDDLAGIGTITYYTKDEMCIRDSIYPALLLWYGNRRCVYGRACIKRDWRKHLLCNHA